MQYSKLFVILDGSSTMCFPAFFAPRDRRSEIIILHRILAVKSLDNRNSVADGSIVSHKLTSVEFLALGIDVFDVENILEQHARHFSSYLTQRLSGAAVSKCLRKLLASSAVTALGVLPTTHSKIEVFLLSYVFCSFVYLFECLTVEFIVNTYI